MSHWNYRVIRHKESDGSDFFAIHEVHYDDDGNPVSYTENGTAPGASTLEGVWAVLEAIMADVVKPDAVLEICPQCTLIAPNHKMDCSEKGNPRYG